MTEHDEIRALAARDAVARTIVLYGQLLDDHRWDDLGGLFTAKALWQTADVTLETRAAIVDGLRTMQAPKPGTVKHLSFPPVIDLPSATSARAWTDFVCVHCADGTWSVVSGGRYHDQLVVDEDRWRIASRVADVQGTMERALPDGWEPSPGR